MKLLFIRHGQTKGNLENKYIGTTDEPLCQEGIETLKKLFLPTFEIIISSPMKRCIQTAEILFPNHHIAVEDELRECDFGDFENHNYNDLSDNGYYQKWIDSNGQLPFPNGESPSEFKKRCIESFESIIKKHMYSSSIAFIVHGGTIMSILEKYAYPHKGYFDWQCKNCHGYSCEWDGQKINISEKL